MEVFSRLFEGKSSSESLLRRNAGLIGGLVVFSLFSLPLLLVFPKSFVVFKEFQTPFFFGTVSESLEELSLFG